MGAAIHPVAGGDVHRHGRTFADGAIEHDFPVTRLAQHAEMLVEAAVRRVNGPRNDARFHPFALFAKIDDDHPLAIVPDDGFRGDCRHLALAFQIQPHADIFRHGHIHHFRVRQVQPGHQFDVFGPRADLESRIVGAFLGNGRHHVALIVVRRIDKRAVGKLQHAVEQRIILLAGIAILEIGSPGAPDQQRVAGKDPVIHAETIAVIGMAGGMHRREVQPLDGHPFAVGDAHRHHVDRRLLAHHRDTVGAVAKRPHGGDVIGMNMRINDFHQLQVQLFQKLDIPVGFLEYRIDQKRLSTRPAGKQIGVGRGHGIEHLAENHDGILPFPRICKIFPFCAMPAMAQTCPSARLASASKPPHPAA